jgi:hypothetical protein
VTVSIPSIQVWDDAVANVRRVSEEAKRPGRRLIAAAAAGLGLLDAGLFAVSLRAQYSYIFHAKGQSWPSVIEAAALDAGMVIFSLLALGLALAGQSSRIERALIVLCAVGSAGMNYAAADVSSIRSVAAYVMPSIFLAIVTDRVIAVVRRHVLGLEAEQSAWGTIGRALLAVPLLAARVVLYVLRLVLAPWSTVKGMRRWVLESTPLPAGPARTAVTVQAETVSHEADAGELDTPDRRALPPGSCIAASDSGEVCGRVRPCTRHEPEVSIPGETKKAHLIRLYRDHPRYGDRAWASRAATELAGHVQLSPGTARNNVNEYLDETAREAS